MVRYRYRYVDGVVSLWGCGCEESWWGVGPYWWEKWGTCKWGGAQWEDVKYTQWTKKVNRDREDSEATIWAIVMSLWPHMT